MVIIAGWSGNILHDYHKCLHWEEGSGRIYQAANPPFPSPYSQQFLLNWALTTERCSLRQLQQIYTYLLAEPDEDRVAVVTTSALIIALPSSPRASEDLQGSHKASGWKLGHPGILSNILLTWPFIPFALIQYTWKNIYEMKIPGYFFSKKVKMLHLGVNISKCCYTTKALHKIFWW